MAEGRAACRAGDWTRVGGGVAMDGGRLRYGVNICALIGKRCGAVAGDSGDNRGMKTARTFKGSWFVFALVAAIVLGEVIAWEISSRLGVRSNPIVVGFLCAGLVAAITSVLYEGADIG